MIKIFRLCSACLYRRTGLFFLCELADPLIYFDVLHFSSLLVPETFCAICGIILCYLKLNYFKNEISVFHQEMFLFCLKWEFLFRSSSSPLKALIKFRKNRNLSEKVYKLKTVNILREWHLFIFLYEQQKEICLSANRT